MATVNRLWGCANLYPSVVVVGGEVLKKAVRVHIVGHVLDGGGFELPLIERGKAKLRKLGMRDNHDSKSAFALVPLMLGGAFEARKFVKPAETCGSP